MNLQIPELSLVVLIGASSSGKSTFARRCFRPTEVISSDYCRALVADDENVLDANEATFGLLHFIVRKRLERGLLTVVDATNLQEEARRPLLDLAREQHVFAVAIALNPPEDVLHERNRQRTDRQVPPHVLRNHHRQLRRSLRRLRREGFRFFYELKTPGQAEAVQIERTRSWNNKREAPGPFDIIGDVHGCFDELCELLERLGYRITAPADRGQSFGYTVEPPKGRQAVFLGDLTDRGPASPEVLRLVMSMVGSGAAWCVAGNHDAKLLKKLQGRQVQLRHGLERTMEQLAGEPPEFIEQVKTFLDGLISHYVFDEGRLVVAHAGLRAEMQGRASGAVRSFCLFGETTGEIDEFGLPVRYPWAEDYRGAATVVYGHTPVPAPEWRNRTINIDTGCVFGGRLTALRYPERELVSVPARRVYEEPRRPLMPPAPVDDHDLLDLGEVLGRQTIETRLRGRLSIREEQAAAALEVMSRYAVDPRWLIYLPPTMSPSATSTLPGCLEHPAEAFAYYRGEGVERVICQEKHMGSRALVVIGKDSAAIQDRFGITSRNGGCVFTRTGRAFFTDMEDERALLERLRAAMDRAGFWERHRTGWALFDCELMPWSAKAQGLLREQYAPVAAAGGLSLEQALAAAGRAAERLPELGPVMEALERRRENIRRFGEAYRRYCWEVKGVEDLRLAPFHLLATEGAVHVDKDHPWHLEEIDLVCREDPQVLLTTDCREVDLEDPASEAAATAWWEELTGRGGEGMVVKPLAFVEHGEKGLLQPALKCRGPEYLRIIYGPDYDLPDHLEELRRRGLGRKRSLALREFALGVEALDRFVSNEPLRRVHQCVFAILALESEPVDASL